MTHCYADASAILRYVLNQPGSLDLSAIADVVVSSELAAVECHRTLDRIRLQAEVNEEELNRRRDSLAAFLQEMVQLELNRRTLARAAGPMEVVVGTLDAIHLATAAAWREAQGQPLTFATHDRALARAARLHGFPVLGLA